MKNIRINEKTFEVLEISFQPKLDGSASIFIQFDVSKNSVYKKFFLDLYDNKTLFNFFSRFYKSTNCVIKSTDLDHITNILSITIKSERIYTLSKREERNEKIKVILKD